MENRPTIDNYYLDIAKAVSARSTCLKKHYGAVLVHPTKGIVSTGYNGAPYGEKHCTICTKLNSGKDIETYLSCVSVHAEMNCIINASKEEMVGATMYLYGYDVKDNKDINAIPCEICFRLLKNSGISKVVSRDGACCVRDADGILRRL